MSLIFFLLSCDDKEPKFYHCRIYPVIQGDYENDWLKNEYFYNSTPVTIKIESRIDYEDATWEGRFDSIFKWSAELYIDRDLKLISDTIPKFTNLFNTTIAKFETKYVSRSGGIIPSYYIIWINENLELDYGQNEGYCTIYFKARTEHNNIINDSTVVYIGLK